MQNVEESEGFCLKRHHARGVQTSVQGFFAPDNGRGSRFHFPPAFSKFLSWRKSEPTLNFLFPHTIIFFGYFPRFYRHSEAVGEAAKSMCLKVGHRPLKDIFFPLLRPNIPACRLPVSCSSTLSSAEKPLSFCALRWISFLPDQ